MCPSLQSPPPGCPAGDSGWSHSSVTGQQERLGGWSKEQQRLVNRGAWWKHVCVCVERVQCVATMSTDSGLKITPRALQPATLLASPLSLAAQCAYGTVCVCVCHSTWGYLYICVCTCDSPMTSSARLEAALCLCADRVKMIDCSVPPVSRQRDREVYAVNTFHSIC